MFVAVGGREVLVGVGGIGLGLTIEACGITASIGEISVPGSIGVEVRLHDDNMSNAISRMIAFKYLNIINFP